MPNIIIMNADIGGQRFIVGGYSSHGWLRDSSITQNINGNDNLSKPYRYGFDDAFWRRRHLFPV